MTVQTSRGRLRAAFILMVTGLILGSSFSGLEARPVPKGGKGQQPAPQRFLRQQNTYSNMRFFYTNRGVLFNGESGAGLFWPRSSNDVYIFGSGVWFATKKVISGRRQKLAEIGYNPNSGAGWFTEGEYFPAGKEVNDGATFDSKYISYVSPRYDRTSGKYIGGTNTAVPPPAYNWPLWAAPALDSADQERTLRQNYYFGDYISNVNERTVDALSKGNRVAKPAILSQEDIVNIYSDYNTDANPEFKVGRGYPFFLNIQEVIYSWSFGRYRDMIFLRHRITNAGTEDLFDCYIAPAFDPDLGAEGPTPAQNDRNAYVSTETMTPEHAGWAQAALNEADPGGKRFGGKLENLNMAYQYSDKEKGQSYGMIGFAFLESPAVGENGEIQDNSLPGDDGLPRPQLGLTTMKKWTIANDPPTQDLRYDFVSSGARDNDPGPGDVRLLFATGPFTLKPGKSAETVVGIGIARPSTAQDKPNLDSLIKLMVQAHNVFARVTIETKIDSSELPFDTSYVSTINHFDAPEPPKLPGVKAQGLDKAVLVTWDNNSETSVDDQAEGLPFLGYELWRSTRSDLDSTIQPLGVNPNVRLGRWTLYDMKVDTSYTYELHEGSGTKPDTLVKVFNGLRYKRLSDVRNEIPHSFLDVGDDNKDGAITGSEGLTNGVRYYYYLVAFDEYDSVNNIGPLTTAIVRDINFVSAIPTKPPFVNAPLNLATDLTKDCLSNGGIDTIQLKVVDQGRFQALYTNDKISVDVQPRWYETNFRVFPNLGFLWYYFDINDERQGRALTYDELYNPGAAGAVNPYGEYTGLLVRVPGSEQPDSTWKKRFTSDQQSFAPNQTIDQTFKLIVDYTMHRVNADYKVSSVTAEGQFDRDLLRLSTRTLAKGAERPTDLSNLRPDQTRPTFMGSLGETTYDITFGDYTDFVDVEFDTTVKPNTDITVRDIRDDEGNVFTPRVLPITITSRAHCNAPLKLIRDGRTNDVERTDNPDYYTSVQEQAPNFFPTYNDPDTMLTPIAGHFAVDAWHYTYGEGSIPSDALKIENPRGTTTGNFYFPNDPPVKVNGKTLVTVHRIRVAGAELILNAPGISNLADIGDETPQRDAAVQNDIKPGDKISITFTGLAKNMPFPDNAFVIETSKEKIDFANPNLYLDTVLEQVQVVPNPYIVTHSGQTSTDNAKLYFTRLPPRATIEIYNIAGDLIKTLEHNAYLTGDGGTVTGLASNATMLEWNLLSEGRQRIGSQVLTARIIAKDASGGVKGEVIKKFAVVVGGYRIVR